MKAREMAAAGRLPTIDELMDAADILAYQAENSDEDVTGVNGDHYVLLVAVKRDEYPPAMAGVLDGLYEMQFGDMDELDDPGEEESSDSTTG